MTWQACSINKQKKKIKIAPSYDRGRRKKHVVVSCFGMGAGEKLESKTIWKQTQILLIRKHSNML